MLMGFRLFSRPITLIMLLLHPRMDINQLTITRNHLRSSTIHLLHMEATPNLPQILHMVVTMDTAKLHHQPHTHNSLMEHRDILKRNSLLQQMGSMALVDKLHRRNSSKVEDSLE